MKDATTTVRLNEALLRRLQAAADRERNPYAPNQSQIIVRGIELALAELEKKARK